MVVIISVILTACGSVSDEDAHFTIGLATNNSNGLKNVQGFRDAMAELGYIEGRNVNYIFTGYPTKGDELVRRTSGVETYFLTYS